MKQIVSPNFNGIAFNPEPEAPAVSHCSLLAKQPSPAAQGQTKVLFPTQSLMSEPTG
jgi:hypothetical protein